MKNFFSISPVWQANGLFLIRVFIGIFLIIHGREVLYTDKMHEYLKWDMFKQNNFLPYAGKAAELVAGILLTFGLFTRLSCLLIIGTFTCITFFVGTGKFWMEDQHPFLFVMFGLLFFFTGPGSLSLDEMIFKNWRNDQT